MKDSPTAYYESLDEALESKTTVSAVLDRRRHEASRHGLMPDAADATDAERLEVERKLAAIEAREAGQREASGVWESLLLSRHRLRTRLANIHGMREQALAGIGNLLLELEPMFGNPSGEFNDVRPIASLAGRLDDLRLGVELLARTAVKVTKELSEFETKIHGFAEEHHIEPSHEFDEAVAE